MVRVRRIELRSQVWKTCILTAVLHPRVLYCSIFLMYNKCMNARFSQFTPGGQDNLFHSSGLTDGSTRQICGGGANVPGFTARRRAAQRRKYISGYRDARVVNSYRQDARERGRLSDTISPDQANDDPRLQQRQHMKGANDTSTPISSDGHTFSEPVSRSRDRYSR